ncbi:MAG: 4Fe-4S binding protein [Candidatus Hodarchaeales archaeon]
MDHNLCIFCWKCAKSCPAEILIRKITKQNTRKGFIEVTDKSACFECRACEIICPVSAIKIKPST